MQSQSTVRFSNKAPFAAQIAYMKAIESLKAHGGLSDADQEFLRSQRPIGVDEEGRLVLEFTSVAAAVDAGSRPVLTWIARHLREKRLAAGLSHKVTASPQENKRAFPDRTGSPRPKVLYLPAFLASVTLPHSQVAGSEFTRVNGDIRLSLIARASTDLPYGVYPRLILMHLTTRALLQRERTFYVGESANEFLSRIGIADTGGVRGTSTRARDQLRRLRLTSFAYHDKAMDRGRNIVLADNWVTWPGHGVQVTLGEHFYSMAHSGSIPLDTSILDSLRRSPPALDAYAWLTYRVARLTRETVVPWRSLEVQFGAECKHPRHFRSKFCHTLATIRDLWPGIDAEPRAKGLLLQPCAPSVLRWLERTAAKSAAAR